MLKSMLGAAAALSLLGAVACTQGPNEEAGREGQQREQERRGVVHAREELLGDDGDQRTVEVEVVPLEYRAERRGENHLFLLSTHGSVVDGC